MMKIIRTLNKQREIYKFKRWFLLNKMVLNKSFIKGDLYDRFKLVHVYLNEGDKVYCTKNEVFR